MSFFSSNIIILVNVDCVYSARYILESQAFADWSDGISQKERKVSLNHNCNRKCSNIQAF